MATYEDKKYNFDAANLTGNDVVKTGTIIPWPTSSIPTGYLDCNGAAVSRSTYSALFSAISTTYGAGDGSSTFNVPDIKDKICNRTNTMGSTGGANTAACSISVSNRTLSLNQIPSHNHNGTPTRAADGIGFGNNSNTMRYQGTYTWNNAGNTGSHNHGSSGGNVSVQAPFVATFFIIKT